MTELLRLALVDTAVLQAITKGKSSTADVVLAFDAETAETMYVCVVAKGLASPPPPMHPARRHRTHRYVHARAHTHTHFSHAHTRTYVLLDVYRVYTSTVHVNTEPTQHAGVTHCVCIGKTLKGTLTRGFAM